MKTFQCDHCGQPVYFENIRCLGCGSTLGILPDSYEVRAVKNEGAGAFTGPDGKTYRLCRNSIEHGACNQLVHTGDASEYCLSCRFTETIPDLTFEVNLSLWSDMERCKRRLLYSLGVLGIRPLPKCEDAAKGLSFRFLVSNDQGILTGHEDGMITITLAEADPAIREARRQQMGEDYRTLLGHFRHEIGHFYWERLIADRGRHDAFRTLFGDERSDYQAALAAHYAKVQDASWEGSYISRYAASHPHEDWAESFAHFLHMRDVVETAISVGLVADPGVKPDFDRMLQLWLSTSFRLNELGRSVGSGDLYPFVLSDTVIRKMRFISGEIESARNGK